MRLSALDGTIRIEEGGGDPEMRAPTGVVCPETATGRFNPLAYDVDEASRPDLAAHLQAGLETTFFLWLIE